MKKRGKQAEKGGWEVEMRGRDLKTRMGALKRELRRLTRVFPAKDDPQLVLARREGRELVKIVENT